MQDENFPSQRPTHVDDNTTRTAPLVPAVEGDRFLQNANMQDPTEARRAIPSTSAPAMLQPDSMNAETASLPGSRRNPLDVFTSMFRRRSLRPAGGPSMTQSSDRIWELLSTSPVRVRNLEQDMEALRQSRHDNPYLQQQMERFSIQDEPAAADERQLLFPPDDFRDLHKHLIRSPPPQFPQDVAHFVFPGSPPPVSAVGRSGVMTCTSQLSILASFEPGESVSRGYQL
ncbi:hypothetical protein HPB49_006319 [Dermacentor silvarum]|uniref:Uncharacterized protein n=1 Tax=Dermacentor silvarum TaxID=543639 RepID=A0ACB8DWD9_DERSI|nr:hypothetical protein HPB49_006319 [Dermacentor silvarum]